MTNERQTLEDGIAQSPLSHTDSHMHTHPYSTSMKQTVSSHESYLPVHLPSETYLYPESNKLFIN